MDQRRLEALLLPFLAGKPDKRPENETFQKLLQYLELLQKWNSRTNLTAIREEDAIVTRHFGESLAISALLSENFDLKGKNLYDFGSGAGFPGVPIAIAAPELEVLLIESNRKKTSFLRELCRELSLQNCTVFAGRAEDAPQNADFVTMRAVDRMGLMVPVAKALLVPRGTLVALCSSSQREMLNDYGFSSVRSVQAAAGVHVLLASAGEKT